MNQMTIVIGLLFNILGTLYTIYGRMCADSPGSDKYAGPILGMMLNWVGWGMIAFTAVAYLAE